MKLLICGGAGYVGSHMVRYLLANQHEVVVYDNLSTGHRQAVPRGVTFAHGDIGDAARLARVFATHRFDAVIHFCARSLVGESVVDPYAYYRNNVANTLVLLSAMNEAGVQRLVFSSTAAVFGNPHAEHIDEGHATAPINPYGQSKLMIEHVLEDAARAYGLRSVALRYFNAAGADPGGSIGEAHDPETHLIPNVLKAVLGQGAALKVFGDDYDTRDGTCVRDYVHVNDLASAHLLAIDYLATHEGAFRFNLGNGEGFSVREVIAAAERVTGKPVPHEIAPRRAGDPATLVASSELARLELGWEPRITRLDDILASAWRWHLDPGFG
ncbi:MAG: UDP-glucose 4-epimerase GalE [Luteibacter sp.]|uniref:UDP-glucose 4-epimerase GalE n=1 Tax=unclassified Luteibacter TaxID=2620188 RepID=UPI002808A4F7|nr:MULTISPECIES: UDP-glucose 4-epimerase GalE [unclassified Luteibacter]MDQ7994924.1 UDP-glucose 4-epimerase GalE [Luteibacter sp.]MDQ8047562.1 UDP-glucose 4-epimerase GalE [Luteibacter sp.]MDR6641220.1 UDP-glucose 4-epimerase [Luteibacter sp. 1214]